MVIRLKLNIPFYRRDPSSRSQVKCIVYRSKCQKYSDALLAQILISMINIHIYSYVFLYLYKVYKTWVDLNWNLPV
jgi:hypothetical protein